MSNNPYQEHIHSDANQPNEPPPAYTKAPGPSSVASHHDVLSVPSTSSHSNPNRLSRTSSDYTYDSREMEQELSSGLQGSHEEHGSGIPIEDRVSMDEERRELPDGWIREFDAGSKHWYYVDTKAKPPRSIWIHPYDDPKYLQSLPDDAPPRVAAENTHKLAQEISSKNQNTNQHSTGGTSSHPNTKDEKKTFGRKMKDKLTGTTHEEREKKRAAQRKAEAEEYRRYLERRKQLLEAQRNGTYRPAYGPPTDSWGRPVYGGYSGYSSYGYPGGRMYSPYGYGGRGYYGGGMGMGGGGMLAGGLLGGMLLGGALF